MTEKMVEVRTRALEEKHVKGELSARVRLREWIREEVMKNGDIKAPKITELSLEYFGDDKTFMAQLGKELLPGAVYELTVAVIGSMRGDDNWIMYDVLPEPIEPVTGGDTKGAVRRRLEQLERRYRNWREHVGDRYVRLTDMTEQDLLLAEHERQHRIDSETRVVAFLAALRQKVTGTGKPVGKVLTVEEMETLRVQNMAPVVLDDDEDDDSEEE